jgi:hypothetical protein
MSMYSNRADGIKKFNLSRKSERIPMIYWRQKLDLTIINPNPQVNLAGPDIDLRMDAGCLSAWH